MTGLTAYLTEDDSWIKTWAEQIGWETLIEYYDRVFLLLLEMSPRTQIKVTDIVHPERYELFIRCACTAIRELFSIGYVSIYIEENATLILKL